MAACLLLGMIGNVYNVYSVYLGSKWMDFGSFRVLSSSYLSVC